jgi:hypothetical protein
VSLRRIPCRVAAGTSGLALDLASNIAAPS